MPKRTPKPLQVVKINEDSGTTPPQKGVGLVFPNKKGLKPKDILRLLSQLLRGFNSGEIDSRAAKDFAYLSSIYLSGYNSVELETRLEELESKLETKGAS